ncbi:MAG: hypothetical protein MRZ26_00320, partial [Ruminococcus sp.]|nr:hypothetical protein [Ruminococcus sp.]
IKSLYNRLSLLSIGKADNFKKNAVRRRVIVTTAQSPFLQSTHRCDKSILEIKNSSAELCIITNVDFFQKKACKMPPNVVS